MGDGGPLRVSRVREGSLRAEEVDPLRARERVWGARVDVGRKAHKIEAPVKWGS